MLFQFLFNAAPLHARGAIWVRLLFNAAVVGFLALIMPVLHVELEWKIYVLLAVGAGLSVCFPEARAGCVSMTGFCIWLLWNHYFAIYFTGTLIVLYLLRGRPLQALAALFLLAFVIPKTLFKVFYGQLAFYGWFDSYGLSLVALGTIYWWVEVRNNRVSPPDWSMWSRFFLFPTQPLNPINFGPSDFAQPVVVDDRGTLRAAGLIALKAACLWLAAHFLGHFYFQAWGGEQLLAQSRWTIWRVAFFNYATTILWLSGTADFVTAIARLYGVPLGFNYRYALLAWNPVELWRRWAIYNRKLLLKLVYFPLGGNHHNRYRNVLLTFLASALVLHSGWVGSYYWEIGVEGWRDYSVYFLLQGVAVCLCLELWKRTGKDAGSDRALRWSWGRAGTTALTQLFSAWLHILILGQVTLTWGERWRVMARCLGF